MRFLKKNFRSTRRLFLGLGLATALAACDLPSGPIGGGGALKTDKVKVALLVPYGSPTSGDEGIARSMENAARLAAADLGGNVVEIKVYRTGGSASTAAEQTNRAAAEGAQIILGPLRSDAANAAALAARDDKLNVLAFSNNTTIAGGNLFILGNTFENTAERLLSYSGRQGRNRLAIIHANNAVGEIARNSVIRSAQRARVQVVASASYAFSQEAIVNATPSIVSRVRSSGANAVMLTSDSTGALPILGQLLPENGLNSSTVKFLGLTRWDIPRQTLSLPALQGGWFALPDPSLNARFNARYQSNYGSNPHPLAALAYDGIAAIGALAKRKRNMSSGNLTQSSGFAGVNGVFRFRPNGTVQRALAIAQVSNGTVQIIDPAPKGFGGAGF